MKKSVYVTLGVLAVSLGLAFGAKTVSAEDVAPSYIASPDVYKLISENENFRVIMATWKPGQRDKWHSHEGPAAKYRLNDCSAMRAYTPDGKSTERGGGKRGEVKFNPAITSHSMENIGTTDCQVLIVEKK